MVRTCAHLQSHPSIGQHCKHGHCSEHQCKDVERGGEKGRQTHSAKHGSVERYGTGRPTQQRTERSLFETKYGNTHRKNSIEEARTGNAIMLE